jgi:hypothetical protein
MPTRSDRYSNVSGAVAYDQYALLLRFCLNKRMLTSIHWIAAKKLSEKWMLSGDSVPYHA